MAYGHGGRREGAGRPQGASSHRNLPFGTLTAGFSKHPGVHHGGRAGTIKGEARGREGNSGSRPRAPNTSRN
jgi:hypothetical protein